MTPLTAAQCQLRGLLTALAALFFAAALAYELGPVLRPFRALFHELPFVSNSVVKVSVLGLCCLYAAGDVRNRRGLVLLVIVAHGISVAAMAVLLVVADTARTVAIGASAVPVYALLWGAIALDGVIMVVLAAFLLWTRSTGGPTPSSGKRLTAAERRLKTLLAVLAVLFAGAAVLYEVGPLLNATRALFVELPFVTNSVVKVSVLGLLCGYAARDLRRAMPVAGLVIAGHVVSLAAMALFFLVVPSQTTAPLTVGTRTISAWNLLAGAMVLDGVIAVMLFLAYQAAWRARFNLGYLRPTEFRALVALADVLVLGDSEAIPPEQIASNVDRYVRPIRAKRRWVYRACLVAVQLHPLLYMKAPFSELDGETRLRHIKRHFRRDVVLKAVPDWWRRIIQIVIRVSKQLTYIGYYNDPASFASVGYARFSDRRRAAGLDLPSKSGTTLEVLTPERISSRALTADVCVIGSGAAGAILAYRLAERGKSVLLVERGRYVPPAEFSEDEVDMIGRLYADGVFQQTEDFRFTILQGSCVGGSTVVNNAVCFDPPEAVLTGWNAPAGQDAGLDLAALYDSVREVRCLIQVRRQDHDRLNPSAVRFVQQAGRSPGRSLEVDVVEANISDCLGCGYCNIGCAYGHKLSMLDRVLPEAQRRFGERVRILAECEVTRLRTLSGRPPRVVDARGRLSDGRTVTLEADAFVVAAGAVASPYVLLQSGLGRTLPVGHRMSFNMGAAVTAEFPDQMDAYDGLQISHYMRPRAEHGFVTETWWNPPVAQAINMPGWFEEHLENMRRYRYLMAVGVLVGTEGNARVRRALLGGPAVVYTPAAGDLRKLGDGLRLTAEILFEAGAKRVMLNTWGYDVFTHPNQLERVEKIVADPAYMALGTGHPQGGNAVSRDPRRGVVNEDFRVHGFANLYVCDASVFPSSLTVNPQLTVMALADYAAARIAQ